MKFFTLLFIDENKQLSVNLNANFENQIRIFKNCCINLNESLKNNINHELIILTNNKSFISKIIKNIEIIEIDFYYVFPSKIDYFAAHHKLNVYNWISRNINDYCFIIDNDIICINNFPINIKKCVEQEIPLYYNISDQLIPAFTREDIINSKNIVYNNNKSIGMWAGGEFISGNQSFFKKLDNKIQKYYHNYISNHNLLFHQSDETLTSIAIEEMLCEGYTLIDAGLIGGITRYWSYTPKHIQKDIYNYNDYFLLHLPTDKKYLAELKETNNFLINYIKYLSSLKENKQIQNKPFKIIIKRFYEKFLFEFRSFKNYFKNF